MSGQQQQPDKRDTWTAFLSLQAMRKHGRQNDILPRATKNKHKQLSVTYGIKIP